MASVKIMIDNICVVTLGTRVKSNPVERDMLSSCQANLSQLPLSEDKIVTLLFSCHAREMWIGNMEPSVPLDIASHVVKVKMFFRRRRRR